MNPKERHTGTEMKKIVCLILALCCIFSMVSCFGGGDDENPDKAFFDAVAASKPTQIKTLTYYTEEGKDPLNGTFETTILNEDGDFTFVYSYVRIATLEDAENGDVVINGNRATVSGTVYYKNGKYSTDGEVWFSKAPSAMEKQLKLELDREKLGEYEMNDSKTTLTATLSPEAAAEVLGIVIEADSDIVITVSTNGTYLTRVTVSYTKGAANVTINTSYS